MGTDAMPAAGTGWKIDHMQSGIQPGPGGQFVRGTTVSFTSGDGHQGSVFVPDTQLTRDAVARAVAAKAQTLDSIGRLSG